MTLSLARLTALAFLMLLSASCSTSIENATKTAGYDRKIESFSYITKVDPHLQVVISARAQPQPIFGARYSSGISTELSQHAVRNARQRLNEVLRATWPSLQIAFETRSAKHNTTTPTHIVELHINRALQVVCSGTGCGTTIGLDANIYDATTKQKIWTSNVIIRPPYSEFETKSNSSGLEAISPASAAKSQADQLVSDLVSILEKQGLLATARK